MNVASSRPRAPSPRLRTEAPERLQRGGQLPAGIRGALPGAGARVGEPDPSQIERPSLRARTARAARNPAPRPGSRRRWRSLRLRPRQARRQAASRPPVRRGVRGRRLRRPSDGGLDEVEDEPERVRRVRGQHAGLAHRQACRNADSKSPRPRASRHRACRRRLHRLDLPWAAQRPCHRSGRPRLRVTRAAATSLEKPPGPGQQRIAVASHSGGLVAPPRQLVPPPVWNASFPTGQRLDGGGDRSPSRPWWTTRHSAGRHPVSRSTYADATPTRTICTGLASWLSRAMRASSRSSTARSTGPVGEGAVEDRQQLAVAARAGRPPRAAAATARPGRRKAHMTGRTGFDQGVVARVGRIRRHSIELTSRRCAVSMSPSPRAGDRRRPPRSPANRPVRVGLPGRVEQPRDIAEIAGHRGATYAASASRRLRSRPGTHVGRAQQLRHGADDVAAAQIGVGHACRAAATFSSGRGWPRPGARPVLGSAVRPAGQRLVRHRAPRRWTAPRRPSGSADDGTPAARSPHRSGPAGPAPPVRVRRVPAGRPRRPATRQVVGAVQHSEQQQPAGRLGQPATRTANAACSRWLNGSTPATPRTRRAGVAQGGRNPARPRVPLGSASNRVRTRERAWGTGWRRGCRPTRRTAAGHRDAESRPVKTLSHRAARRPEPTRLPSSRRATNPSTIALGRSSHGRSSATISSGVRSAARTSSVSTALDTTSWPDGTPSVSRGPPSAPPVGPVSFLNSSSTGCNS